MSGDLLWLAKFHHAFVILAEITAIVTNTIVVCLVVTERKKLYVDYQRVLILNCIVDYLCSFLGLILRPQYEVLEGQWIFILNAPLTYLPKNGQIVAAGLYSFINCFGISTIPVQFLYRKRMICDERKMSSCQIFLFTLMCAVVSIFGVYIFIECFYASEGVKFKRQELIDSGLPSEFSVLLNAEVSTTPMFILTNIIFVLIVLVYGSIFVWSRQVYQKLNEIDHRISANTRRLQSHFNRMLASQIACILLFACIPGCFFEFLLTNRVDIIGAGTSIAILFVCVPLINPLCTLLLVGQFRHRFFVMIRIAPASLNKTPVESVENTQV